MRTTTTLIIGLVAASMLVVGGGCGFVAGAFASGFEETFEELSAGESSQGSSGDEMMNAGAVALLVAILLYAGAGIAKVALRTSTILLALSVFMIFVVLTIDALSIFAAFYYIAFVLTVIGVILMIIEWVKIRRGVS